MKLIIVGATGFVGSEVLRQALKRSDITSIVAVTRRALPPPSSENATSSAKLIPVVVPDYDQYDQKAKDAFKGADGCVWAVAITPTRSSSVPWAEVVRVCQTSTLVGLHAMHDARPASPFRFLYMSGAAGERDQSKTPWYKPQYTKMRGETETQVLAYASNTRTPSAASLHAPNFSPFSSSTPDPSTEPHSNPTAIHAAIAKPGLIIQPNAPLKQLFATALSWTVSVPSVGLEDVARAMLGQVVKGFEKDTLENSDLVRLGKVGAGSS